ncbi:MAG: hypothetical protein ACM30I_15750 [Gemmatimonas sp.]
MDPAVIRDQSLGGNGGESAKALHDLVAITWDGKGVPHRLVCFDQTPAFDLLTLDYTGSADSPSPLVEHHHFRSVKTEGKGETFQVVADFLRNARRRYRYVGILDDDIILRVSDINYLLHVAGCFNLDSFAPSLGEDGFHSHVHTLRQDRRLLHPAPWVEVMMPFYKVELFEMAAPFFNLTISSWGIDKYVIPLMQKIAGMPRTAVVDGILATHTRPIRSAGKRHSNGLSPFEEMDLVRERCIEYVEAHHPELVRTRWFDETFELLGPIARLRRKLRLLRRGAPPPEWQWKAP